MEKEICRRQLSREGIGCVWVFMNMFDFRHGGSNQKLIMDKKRGSKRIIGNIGVFETKESEVGMQSVKNLIEEETQQKAKNRKRRSRTCSNTSVLSTDDDDDHHAEKLDDQCPRVSQSEEADSVNDDDSEEKFSELIKRLIAQKESEIKSCKNLLDAFQDLDSKEESSFLDIDEPVSKSSPESTQTIVVLKPEDVDCRGNKTKFGRFGSRFILSRIRRRLKAAVGKNPCNAQHESDQEPAALSPKCCFGEEIETNSGLLVTGGERLPEIDPKSEANEQNSINRSEEDSKKSMCGIYITAKKHLSDMLAEGDTDVDLPDKEVPRILGKILALPDFATPESSPRMTLAHDVVGYSEPLVVDSNKHEEIASIIDIPIPEDTNKEEEEKTVLDSLSEAISIQDAYVDENEHKQHSEKETSNEIHSPCSPPNSSVRMSECHDVPGKSSPVSVLEPLFTDDETSPCSSRFSSVEMRMQPLCIRFEEPDSPTPDKDNDIKTSIDDKELVLTYIQDVVKSSDLNWEELLARSFYSDQLLEQALMDEIDFCSTNLCSNKKLLFDCINEVLMEFCGHGPWVSFVKPAVRFLPVMENVTEVVQEEVYWHLLPLPSPHTLDQIVRKDLAKSGNWMDIRFAIGCIGSETGEIILDELIEETIRLIS